MTDFIKRKVLIFGKTYPEPSSKYLETVCTGGIDEEGKLIRLYPLSFRYLDQEIKFTKWQWIEVGLKKATDDPRPESFRPDESTIKPGDKVDTRDNWRARKDLALRDGNVFSSIEALQAAQERDKTSIGLVKPVFEDFIFESTGETDWSEKQKTAIYQGRLFAATKPLEYIPWRFVFKFTCGSTECKTVHKISNLDWEMFELYRTCRGKYGAAPRQWQPKMREKIDAIMAPERDTYFFMGNMRLHPHVFCIVGILWPKKDVGRQGTLF